MKKNFVLFLIAVFFSLTVCSCGIDSDDKVILQDFEYSISGRDGLYNRIDSPQDLSNLKQFLPDNRGYIYIKSHFTLSETLKTKPVSIYLGIVKIASETYINGNLIGSSGFFPPNTFTQGDIPTYFNIPSAILNTDGENEIIIKIWVDYIGTLSNEIFIAPEHEVYDFFKHEDLMHSKASFLCSFIMLVVAFIYFILYIFRPTDKSSLSFSRLNFCSSLYMVTLGIGEFPFMYEPSANSFLMFNKVFLGVISIVNTYFVVSFIRDYLEEPESFKQQLIRGIITIIPSVLIFIPGNMNSFYQLLYLCYIMLAVQVFFAVKTLFIAFKKKNTKLWALLIGFIPIIISMIISLILILMGKSLGYLPAVLGWQLTILTFLAIMILKFAKMGNQIEFLNNNLEKIVHDRTNELQCTNELLEETNNQLEFEKKRSEKELSLAAFVQQSFYKNTIPELPDWDIGLYFKPLLGVSGDLYDFFSENKSLDGFGIFDISGHGIASALVTMLVKNIIHQEFYIGESLPLVDVMDIINNRVTEEKGNIENYLTGILARVHENHRIEFVNAGHPYPILYTTKDHTAKCVEETDPNHCGVIGIPDLKMDFSLNTIHLHAGDSLLLYTDGIIEAENEAGESFGIDRLIKIFQENQSLSIQDQYNKILTEVKSFIKSDIIEDDITILIIRRK